MSFATIQGQPVICAVFNHPLTGAWTAEVAVDARAVIKGSATVKVGKTSWVGTIRRAGDWKGTILLRMIGGADGLSTSLPSKYYDAPNVGLVFRDICSTVKEKVSNTTDPVLNQSLKAWTRVSGPAGEALAALAKAVGATWRVLPDGTVWFGKEKWKPSAVKFEQLEFDPQAGRVGLWSEEPSLFPGVMLDKKKVTRVEHRIEDRIRTSVWFEDNEDSGDDFVGAVEDLVRHLTAGIDYFADYQAKAVSQNSDGTLELQPDDKRLPGFSKIKIRYGVPGIKAVVKSGARVAVTFEAGDPSRPVATIWESATVEKLTVTADTVEVKATTAKVEATGTCTVKGQTVDIQAATAIKLGGSAAVLAVAVTGDMAGPYPVSAKGQLVKAAIAGSP